MECAPRLRLHSVSLRISEHLTVCGHPAEAGASSKTALCKRGEPALTQGALAPPRLPYQLPLCAMPRFFDLLPASLVLQPPQGQGLREAGMDHEGQAGGWHSPAGSHLTSGAAHLHEGLSLQCARCLHHAVPKLQILFQGQ